MFNPLLSSFYQIKQQRVKPRVSAYICICICICMDVCVCVYFFTLIRHHYTNSRVTGEVKLTPAAGPLLMVRAEVLAALPAILIVLLLHVVIIQLCELPERVE